MSIHSNFRVKFFFHGNNCSKGPLPVDATADQEMRAIPRRRGMSLPSDDGSGSGASGSMSRDSFGGLVDIGYFNSLNKIRPVTSRQTSKLSTGSQLENIREADVAEDTVGRDDVFDNQAFQQAESTMSTRL